MATNSLGQLTLDLVARTGSFVKGLDTSQRSAARWRKGVERDLARVGTAMAAVGTAAAGAYAAMVVQTTNQARELENLARISDSTTQEFQRNAYGASRVGIEYQNLADIYKDMNDRVGDFIATGGGPMADFFENIAPQVGVTANEFARLSGPQALQLYVSSLEAAGIGQKEMTFYMEAIASDATALIPLLANNGEEMRRLGDEAERTGNVFSELEMEQLGAIKESMDELTGAATGMKNEMVLAALPAIEDFTDLLGDPESIESAKALGNAIVTAMGWAVTAIRETVEGVQWLAEEMAAFVNGPGLHDIDRLREQVEDQEALIDRMTHGPAQAPRSILDDELAKLEDYKERLRQGIALQEQFGSTGGSGDQPDPGDGRSIMEVFLGEGLELADKGLGRVGQAADDAAAALDGFNPSKSEEVESILDRAGEGSSIDAEGKIRDAWGNTLPTLQRELDAELERQVADFKSSQNLQAGLEAAAQAFTDGASVAAKAAWASVMPQGAEGVAAGVVPTTEQTADGTSTIRWSTDLGAEKVNQVASQVSGASSGGASGGGGNKQLGTLTLKSEGGGSIDVFTEHAEAAEKWLADTLSGVAAGSR